MIFDHKPLCLNSFLIILNLRKHESVNESVCVCLFVPFLICAFAKTLKDLVTVAKI